jgi:hypothetical protein
MAFGQDITFPSFAPLGPEVYGEYQGFVYAYPQHCDYALNNLLVWLSDGDSSIEWSQLNGNLVLRGSGSLCGSMPDEKWVTVLGDSKADETLDEILSEPEIDHLEMVPDYFVEALRDPEKYDVTADDANSDYVLEIDPLAKMEGKKYEHFRYEVNHFRRHYGESAEVKEIDLQSAEGSEAVLGAMRTWARVNSFSPDGNDPERVDEKAIQRLIGLQPTLPVKHHCIGVYVEGVLEGFSIFHMPHAKDRIALGNHIKYNAEYRRMFAFLVSVTAQRLCSDGTELLNAEQDMGIEGLRKRKMALRPAMYYKKYAIGRAA